jgi:diguanylate cyclase (GGDEF)-like protein
MAKKARDRRTKTLRFDAELRDRLRELQEENRRLRSSLELAEGSRGGLAERFVRVGEIAQELSTLDLGKIGRVATTAVPALVGARVASLYLYDYEADELSLLANNHSRDLTEKISVPLHRNTVMVHAFLSRKPLVVSDFREYERSARKRLERPFANTYEGESCISLPLQSANFMVGALNLADKRGARAFDPAGDVPPLEQVGRILAMALRNCRLFKEVQSQAHTDALTGLGNHRAFQNMLRAEMHRAERYERPLGLVMLDVDSFKELNDRYGHQAGDAALKELGRTLLASLRREDYAARYGGDEIAIILPETRPRGGIMAVQRLMAAVRGREFAFEGKRMPLSVSVGLAAFKAGMTPEQFVGAADEALYRAKQAGRDRHEVAAEPPAE